jgi:sulfatase maturation enzyme AslB (radical SAM superfamily)
MKNLVANIVLSDDCNLRCKYCTFRQGKYGRKLNINTHLATLEWINKNYFGYKVQINFSYGEPLTEFETLSKLIEKATAYKVTSFSVRFFTNGVLLSDDKIKFLRKHKDKIEMILSSDGDNYGNRFRVNAEGKKLGELVNVQNLIDNNRDIIKQISVTICPDNVGEFYDNVIHTLDFYGIRKILFSLCVDCDWSDENIKTLASEFNKVIKEFMARYGTEEEFITPTNIFEETNTENRDMLSFDSEGDIYSCILAERLHKKMGNVFSGQEVNKENYIHCPTLKADCRLCFADKTFLNTRKIIDTFVECKRNLFDLLNNYNKLKSNILYKNVNEQILKNMSGYEMEWDGADGIIGIRDYLKALDGTQQRILEEI